MNEVNRIITIDLKDGNVLKIKTSFFEDEIDLDELLSIKTTYIEAELVTFAVVLNKLGLLLADANNQYNLAKLNLEIYEAKKKEKIRNGSDVDYEDDEETGKSKLKKLKKPSLDEVEVMVSLDPVYQNYKRTMYAKLKNMEYMNSIYWAAKTKDDKLNRLMGDLKSGDVYEALAVSKLKSINGVDLSVVKPLIR